MKRAYNKLVRDKIPEIIRAAGEEPEVRTLNDQEFKEALVAKLGEEYEEFKENPSLEEMADYLELVHAWLELKGYSYEELESTRIQKRKERGGFSKRIFLIASCKIK